jgi:hypothetical protein
MKATARDVGFLIRDLLEGRRMHILMEQKIEEGDVEDIVESGFDTFINLVDVGDADRPIVYTDDGQAFAVTITKMENSGG